ncbi:MAG: GIY-YIG nuclease family protein [Dongiaceae bacterium]
MGGFVYILAGDENGTLYVGITSNLARRIYEHREELADGFTKKYGIKRLVYFEYSDDIRDALQREKNLKKWPRAWKIDLIEKANPNWHDLYPSIANG